MLILFQYQHSLKVFSSKFFLFSGEHGGSAVGRVEHEPGVQEPRSPAVDRRPAAATAPPAGSQPFPGCLQDDHLFLKFVSSFPFSAQLAPVPAAPEGWAHRGTSWRCEPSISCQHGGADATPGCPTIQVNVTLNFILNHVVTFVTTGRAVLRTSLSLGSWRRSKSSPSRRATSNLTSCRRRS